MAGRCLPTGADRRLVIDRRQRSCQRSCQTARTPQIRQSIDTTAAGQTADKVLGIIDRHLQRQDWLVGDSVSIADIAVYPYLALAPEGGLDIGAFPNIIAWFQRIRALPGYVAMPGMWQA